MRRAKILCIVLFLFCATGRSYAHEESAPPTFSSIDNVVLFTWNALTSYMGFFLINNVLYVDKMIHGKYNVYSLMALSLFDVSKNIVNYAWVENEDDYVGSFALFHGLNVFRELLSLPPVPTSLMATACELAKAKLNFKVTEQWFPIAWSKPPENPQTFPQKH